MELKNIENMYEMAVDSWLRYGAEVWGIDEGWERIDAIHGRIFKKFVDVTTFTVNAMDETKLGTNSGRGKVVVRVFSLLSYFENIE
jgi:hypothetical protein